MSDVLRGTDRFEYGRMWGRLPEFDERSRSYPVRGVLFSEGEPIKAKTWRRPRAYDQGATSSCVGQSVLGLVNSQPSTGRVPYRTRCGLAALRLYDVAQELDEWPGKEPDYYGTSVLAGVKALVSFIGERHTYRWCFGLSDVLRTLSYVGPVVIGVNWYESMMYTDARGLVKIENQRIAGGHAVELIGVDPKRSEVIGMNSWGPTWGFNGRFRLGYETLSQLLREDGEAVVLT